MILLFENIIRSGISIVLGERIVRSDENNKISDFDAKNIKGCAMIQSLPYGEVIFEKDVNLQDSFNTEDKIDIGYSLEIDSKWPNEIKAKTRHFAFCPEN